MDKTSKSILRFMLSTLMIVAIGIALPVIWYVAADPFKVLRHYDDYFPDPRLNPVRIGVNKGLATFSNFEDRRKEGKEYDSFIFGSSISCYYDASAWTAFLEESVIDSIGVGQKRSVTPYHFDSASETLMSLARKVCWLDREGIPVRNALIVLDPIIMASESSDSPAYLDPPQLHDSFLETLKYHYTFFRAAANADFLKSYFPSVVMKRPIENGHNLIFERQPIVYDKMTNQETIPQWDSIISVNPGAFYREHPLKDAPENLSESKPLLTGSRLEALQKIADVFKRQSTDYRIIIGPNRSKVSLSPADLETMKKIFDEKRIHDFSSSLAFLLEEDTMLYDNTHYRPSMAEIMMRKAYLGQNDTND